MKKNLKKTIYYNESGWQLYESVREDLRTILEFLKAIQFESYWQQNILPKVERKIEEIKKDLPKYNVITEVEKLLGFGLPSNELTVYMFAGFVEEDCVQALEQVINEKFKVQVEAHQRWKNNDDGMHVFAVTLYSVMKEERFEEGRKPFRGFLIRMIRSGKLAAGRIKHIYDAFYSSRPSNNDKSGALLPQTNWGGVWMYESVRQDLRTIFES